MNIYVLLIQAYGDGSSDYGRRTHAIHFNTKKAVQAAYEFFKTHNDVLIVEDTATQEEHCQKCGCALNGEAAQVVLCHPCADAV